MNEILNKFNVLEKINVLETGKYITEAKDLNLIETFIYYAPTIAISTFILEILLIIILIFIECIFMKFNKSIDNYKKANMSIDIMLYTIATIFGITLLTTGLFYDNKFTNSDGVVFKIVKLSKTEKKLLRKNIIKEINIKCKIPIRNIEIIKKILNKKNK